MKLMCFFLRRYFGPHRIAMMIVGCIIFIIGFLITLIWSVYDTIKCEIRRKETLKEAEENYDILSPKPEGMTQRDVSYISSDGVYVQNNTKAVQAAVAMTTPFFGADRFLNTAKEKFGELVRREITVDGLDNAIIPYEYKTGQCFLHNYILQDGTESIKVFMNIKTTGGTQNFFMTFSRQNPSIHVFNGHKVWLSCPNCGGDNIEFLQREKPCPFCNKKINFNGEWEFTEIEAVTERTIIEPRAVTTSY